MARVKGNFKGRVFGGFNRQDVIGYIEKLAEERNALKRENSRLRDRIEELEQQLEEQSAPEAPSIDAADLAARLRELTESVSGARQELDGIKTAHTGAMEALEPLSERLGALQTALEDAGERLGAITAELEGGEPDAEEL